MLYVYVYIRMFLPCPCPVCPAACSSALVRVFSLRRFFFCDSAALWYVSIDLLLSIYYCVGCWRPSPQPPHLLIIIRPSSSVKLLLLIRSPQHHFLTTTAGGGSAIDDGCRGGGGALFGFFLVYYLPLLLHIFIKKYIDFLIMKSC